MRVFDSLKSFLTCLILGFIFCGILMLLDKLISFNIFLGIYLNKILISVATLVSINLILFFIGAKAESPYGEETELSIKKKPILKFIYVLSFIVWGLYYAYLNKYPIFSNFSICYTIIVSIPSLFFTIGSYLGEKDFSKSTHQTFDIKIIKTQSFSLISIILYLVIILLKN